jgi:hypothetical protein
MSGSSARYLPSCLTSFKTRQAVVIKLSTRKKVVEADGGRVACVAADD